ncbi:MULTISPECIES: membrane protein insertase YidC [Dactylosporangium]|nr:MULTISPECIES: membrane protein insertase YidC [Dactylosporangium]UAC02473.1 membrane protein insertase YidC [Dactylosporangium vinaceum]UWZ50225.1 membrane protein insertase YidC [Dactylosporangium matsuzakiense]
MAGIYWLISKVMLFWHTVWDSILPDHRVLSTNWQWVLAIVFLVITVRVVLFPIFVKQIKSQRAMQAIQPKMKELQEKHKGDRETLQKEVMKLYQEEKVNPLMGCLPMFLQIPVFIGLLHVLRHLRPGQSEHQQTLYGWTVKEFESAVDARLFDAPIVAKFSSSAADLLKIDASSTAVKIVAAILVALMITTTYLTQRQMIKKTGWNSDPQQRMIQKFMLYGIPFFTLTSGWYFPIGVIIYWVTNNAITLGQQYWVLHKYPPPANANTTTTPFKAGGKQTADAKQPSGFGALFSKAREQAAAQQRTNGKGGPVKATGVKANGAKANGAAPEPAGPSRAPKPGAKPINPKKGGAAKRQSG